MEQLFAVLISVVGTIAVDILIFWARNEEDALRQIRTLETVHGGLDVPNGATLRAMPLADLAVRERDLLIRGRVFHPNVLSLALAPPARASADHRLAGVGPLGRLPGMPGAGHIE